MVSHSWINFRKENENFRVFSQTEYFPLTDPSWSEKKLVTGFAEVQCQTAAIDKENGKDSIVELIQSRR